MPGVPAGPYYYVYHWTQAKLKQWTFTDADTHRHFGL